jgi:hypothetical protein
LKARLSAGNAIAECSSLKEKGAQLQNKAFLGRNLGKKKENLTKSKIEKR